jgi:hypothetical protein
VLGTVLFLRQIEQVTTRFDIDQEDIRRYMVAQLKAGTLLKRAKLGEWTEKFRKELELDVEYMDNQVRPPRGSRESREAFQERAWRRI